VTRSDSVIDSIAGSNLVLEADYLERINRGLPATLPMDGELLSDQPKN
jgi:hypothetical protein